jgi:hypothetical protein
MSEQMYRQGDFLFIKVDNIPKNLEEKTDRIVGEGEISGHRHVVSAVATMELSKLFTDYEHNLYIKSVIPTDIVHEEHHTITLPKGNYQVVRQRTLDTESLINTYDPKKEAAEIRARERAALD